MSKGQRLLSFLERAFVVSAVMAVLSRVAVIWPKNMLHDARMTNGRSGEAAAQHQIDRRAAAKGRSSQTPDSGKREMLRRSR